MTGPPDDMISSDDIIDVMARLKGEGRPFALATVVRTEELTSAKPGAKAVVLSDGGLHGWIGGGCTQGAVKRAAAQAIADGRARLLRVRPKPGEGESSRGDEEALANGRELEPSHCPSGGVVELFVEPILPRPMLVVMGASPVGRALAGLARGSGFSLTLAALPEDQALVVEADRRIEDFELGVLPGLGDSAVVVATQGKRDRDALAAALASGAPYVAFVGSRKKAETLKAAMRERGLTAEQVGGLLAPAGLDIGAATPQEIAVSILAEIVQHRRRAAAAGSRVEHLEIDGGEVESRAVSPALGACEAERNEN